MENQRKQAGVSGISQKMGGCRATVVCVIRAHKQASSSSGKQVNKREQKETGRYAKQSDVNTAQHKREILKTKEVNVNSISVPVCWHAVMRLVQMTIIYVRLWA